MVNEKHLAQVLHVGMLNKYPYYFSTVKHLERRIG
jgi:hypothetical protein